MNQAFSIVLGGKENILALFGTIAAIVIASLPCYYVELKNLGHFLSYQVSLSWRLSLSFYSRATSLDGIIDIW